MTKYCLLPLSLFICIAAKADPAFSSNSSFNGLYAGISAGASSTTGAKDIAIGSTVSFNSVINKNFLNASNTLIENAAKGALFAGYGHTWQRLYLGTEIFGDFSRYDVTGTEHGDFLNLFTSFILNTKTQIKLKPLEYGIDFRPGFLLTPDTLLYARIGTAINKLSLKSEASATFNAFTFDATPESFTIPESSSAQTTRAALRLGVGLEQRINQFAIRMDYIETNYRKVKTNGGASTLVQSDIVGPTTININNNTNVKVVNNTLMLGIAYYFSPQKNTFNFVPNIFTNNSGKIFNGFYAGLEGGGSFTTATGNFLAQAKLEGLQDYSTFASSSDLKNNSSKEAIYGGYSHSWDYFYLGSEIFADYSNYEMKSSGAESFQLFLLPPPTMVDDFSTFLNVTNRLNRTEYGIDLRPGLLLKPDTLLYGRIGVAVNKLILESDAASTLQFFPPLATAEEASVVLPVTESKTRGALRLGLGIEQGLTHSLSIRADYIYTDYGRININKATSSFVNFVNLAPQVYSLINRANTHVTNNTAMIGVTYYIN